MGGTMSALQKPIAEGDIEELENTLQRFGPAVPLLLQRQFASEETCIDVTPVFCTPLYYCIMKNEPECLDVLLTAGGDAKEKAKGGMNLLHKACKKAALECVKVLLKHGADINDCDEWGVYPIHVCAGCFGDFPESLKILDLLLEAGSPDDIHKVDGEYKKTPLHYAAFNGNTNMCGKLLELGANINAKDRANRTPYQSAFRRPKTKKFLKDCGAEVPDEPTPPPSPYPQQL